VVRKIDRDNPGRLLFDETLGDSRNCANFFADARCSATTLTGPTDVVAKPKNYRRRLRSSLNMPPARRSSGLRACTGFATS
jgi:hypothetical protein